MTSNSVRVIPAQARFIRAAAKDMSALNPVALAARLRLDRQLVELALMPQESADMGDDLRHNPR